jgi:hypothetical protein
MKQLLEDFKNEHGKIPVCMMLAENFTWSVKFLF